MVAQVAQALKNVFEAVSFFFLFKTKIVRLALILMIKCIQLNAGAELSLSSAYTWHFIHSVRCLIIFFRNGCDSV